MMDNLARSVAWIVWSRAIVQVVSFFSTLLVARLLSPADFGLMSLAVIWTGTITLLAELGFASAVVQFPDLEDRELNTCFWLVMGVACAGYLMLYACAPAIAAWFSAPALTDVLRVAGLGLPLAALRTVPDSLLRKRLRLDNVSQAEVAATLATVPVVLGMAWSGAGVWALVAGTLVGPLVQNLASFWFVRWTPGLRLGSGRLREFLGYSLATLGAKALWALFEQADSFVLGKVSGNVVLGFYSMAKTIAALPVLKVAVVANQLVGPIMAGLQTDRPEMRASFLRGLRLVTCLTFPLCSGMALMADDLISVALGEKWMPMVPILWLLSLFWLVRSVDVLMPPVLLARYRAWYLCRWTGGLLLVMLFAFWAGAVSMGALGVSLALVVVYPLITASMFFRGLRELELSWRTVWGELRPILGATVIMMGFVIVARPLMPVSDFVGRLVRLAATSGLGAAVYSAGIFLHGGPLAREIPELATWLLWRREPIQAAK